MVRYNSIAAFFETPTIFDLSSASKFFSNHFETQSLLGYFLRHLRTLSSEPASTSWAFLHSVEPTDVFDHVLQFFHR
jgi:hypothetical protein